MAAYYQNDYNRRFTSSTNSYSYTSTTTDYGYQTELRKVSEHFHRICREWHDIFSEKLAPFDVQTNYDPHGFDVIVRFNAMVVLRERIPADWVLANFKNGYWTSWDDIRRSGRKMAKRLWDKAPRLEMVKKEQAEQRKYGAKTLAKRKQRHINPERTKPVSMATKALRRGGTIAVEEVFYGVDSLVQANGPVEYQLIETKPPAFKKYQPKNLRGKGKETLAARKKKGK